MPHLVVEPVEAAGVARERRGQELQRDRLPELQVVGAIDLAHAALAESRDDAVPLAEHGARGRSGRGRRPTTTAILMDGLRGRFDGGRAGGVTP